MCSVFWSGSRRCCAEKYGTRGEQAVNTGQHNLRHGNMDMFHDVSMCLCGLLGLLSHFHNFHQFSTFPLGGCVESPGVRRHSTGRQASELTLAASGRTEVKNWISDFKEVKTKIDKAPSFWTFLDRFHSITLVALVALVLCHPCIAGRPVCPGSFGVWLSRRMTESYEYLPSQDHSKFS